MKAELNLPENISSCGGWEKAQSAILGQRDSFVKQQLFLEKQLVIAMIGEALGLVATKKGNKNHSRIAKVVLVVGDDSVSLSAYDPRGDYIPDALSGAIEQGMLSLSSDFVLMLQEKSTDYQLAFTSRTMEKAQRELMGTDWPRFLEEKLSNAAPVPSPSARATRARP